MATMLVTINISKGWDTWSKMAIDLEPQETINWESVSLSANVANLIQEIENRLREEEWITPEWSPVHLKSLLERWDFRG